MGHKPKIATAIIDKIENNYLRELLLEFKSNKKAAALIYDDWFTLVNSFGESINAICDYKSFTNESFWKQINCVLAHSGQEQWKGTVPVLQFYRFLVAKYDEYDIFANSQSMTKTAIFFKRLSHLLESGYHVVKYDYNNRCNQYDKILYILSGSDRLSTKLAQEDFFAIDYSEIKFDKYKEMAKDWMYESGLIASKRFELYHVINCMNMIYDYKLANKNKRFTHFTREEAMAIKKYVAKRYQSQASRNGEIQTVRRFLKWANERDLITVEPLLFDYLQGEDRKRGRGGSVVPEEDLIKLNNELLNRSKQSTKSFMAYVIFHLLLQTEFRVSQICNLKIDCIRPSIKNKQYIIKTNSKVSYGGVDSYVVSELTYKLLMDAIDAASDIRDNTVNESIKDYVFIYKSVDIDRKYSKTIFRDELKYACDAANIPRYNAANLRDTHMTKAYEFILKSDRSSLDMSMLSKHRSLDTTKSHYIDIELEKMLEASYGVTIGDDLLNTTNKVIDDLPQDINNAEHDVENGCGKCSANTCLITNALPCLACKHFVTTPKHLSYFEKAIAVLDHQLQFANTPHDKEDLVKMKTFYALYIRAIYQHMKGDNIND